MCSLPPLCPIALPLEHHLNPSNRFCSGQLDPSHRSLMNPFIQVTAQILMDIHLIAIVDRLDRWECDPYGREMTGYEVASLTDTLAKAESLGVSILIQSYSSSGRNAAIVEFPGGYVAEIHGVSK